MENQLVINPDNQSSERNAKVKKGKPDSFTAKMLEAASSGFIPYAQYMKPFVEEIKIENWTAWKRHVEYAGYVLKEGDFGWIVVEKPKPNVIDAEVPKVEEPKFYVTRSLIETITAEIVKRLQESN